MQLALKPRKNTAPSCLSAATTGPHCADCWPLPTLAKVGACARLRIPKLWELSNASFCQHHKFPLLTLFSLFFSHTSQKPARCGRS